MSLLLDALKRAELANEQQLDENESAQIDDILPSDDVFEDVPVDSEAVLELKEESLTVKPTEPLDPLDPLSPEQSAALAIESQPLPNMSFISETLPQSPTSVTETANKLHTLQGKSQSTPADLVDGLNPENVEDESLTVSDVLLPAAPVKLHAPKSQVSAKSAPMPYRPKSKQTSAWFIGVSVLILIFIGASGAYYFMSTLDQLSLDSNVNQVSVPTTEIEDVSRLADVAVTVTPAPADDASTDSLSHLTTVVTSVPKTIIAEKQTTIPLSKSNKSAKLERDVRLKNVEAINKPKKSKIKARKRRVVTSPIEKKATDLTSQKESITIVRKLQVDPVQVLLRNAYEAYVNGNYADARQLYLKVLGLKKNNRDALLGLAVISHRSKQPMLARRYYRQVLSLDPKDSQATAGLISLAQGNNATESESRLKILLEQEPQAAHLHFALGNQYVSQARWADAQQAFFQAYHTDPNNADYAMNLAISLDHIKQPQAALQYYRLALELAQGKNVGFNVLDVARRIKSISKDLAQ